MATTTTLANDIGVLVGSPVIQGFFRNDEFFRLWTQRQAPADTNYRWHILTAGLTGVLKAEGAAFSAAGATTNSRAYLGYHTHDAVVSVTDDLLAALGPNNSNSYWQSLAQEVLQARKAVQQAVMTRWLAATAGTDGLGLAIDSTGVYAGLNHATVTGWTSTETAHGAALNDTVLGDTVETLRDDPIRARPTAILMPENQRTNYSRLSGPGIRNAFNLNAPGTGPANFDIGMSPTGDSYAGIPIYGIPEMTNTEIYFVTLADGMIQYRQRAVGDAGGGWASEEIPRGGYVAQVAISWNGHLCYTDPGNAAKLTGVTA